ncbi:SGNH/GDSL hydrolase family protein [Listeria ivanovii]|uniref:SGNH hydrolase-type esterase domain-containing protein n=1 Tax=Listeria ivanovii (strain ATCC BAA-678 / PAM 55) TaxID=881621 RepID=G2ZC26_LISIP|nr:SGNH/GDSL hydrolase family protein [Listeria ivanovii]AHI56373.1 lipase/acylhydrolase [Listeria ivanovii WSLC3009]AIS65800.1 lipase [Listeria ivanovii subsp. ivanovii]MBC1759169.1 SGNH/GDSL hydrolase family protein [Listeria ivanovii]MBK3914191.1 SGNH/GDSL hydrolase family protein [Listeria ivanovii subsp. ivanovii]MBK3920971.1 SGNH/GDSL hydrolase family protein [Listeria ivanovii subsp. ivanovii]
MTKKKWLWLTGSVLVIALFVGAVFSIKYYQESKEVPIKLVAMGDSLTEGVGDEEKNGGYVGIIPDKLEEQPNVPSVDTSNYGVSGNKITQLEKRLETNKAFQQDVKNANVITITIGGNDVMAILQSRLLEVDVADFTKANKTFQQELEKLITDIRSYNKDAAIFLMGIYNPYTTYFSDIKQFDEVIADWNDASKKTVQKQTNMYFVPIAKTLENRDKANQDKPNPLLSDDYFHPNHQGYEKMSVELDKAIVKQLNEGNIPK